MTDRLGTSSRRLAKFGALLLVSAALWALGTMSAHAADTTATAPTMIQELQQGPLLAFTCNDCHASLATTMTVAAVKGVKFSHGSHMTYDCTACHPRFPHTRAGTERPTVQLCYNCHGLRHGPQGIIAGDDCEKCHPGKTRADLVPADHATADYAGKGHVAPAKDGLRTSCMMCHTQQQCDTCHYKADVSWETTLTFTYDAGNGCLSCHKSELPRLMEPVTSSTLDSSAHRLLTCAECHPDFRYDDKGGATKLWDVNAGLACGADGCHPKQNDEWAKSVHGTAVLTGKDLTAATCGGCHGGHDIERLKTQAAKDRLYLSGAETCTGRCHTHDAAVASYGDWWHGTGYKTGSLDAPACWTCHGAHETAALKDPASMTSPEKLPDTCGQKGCHGGTSESFVETWRTLPHGRPASVKNNPIEALKASLFAGGR